jgi:hypothetical protein
LHLPSEVRIIVGKRDRTFVVVLAPPVQIPLELERQFAVLEHELPDRGDLRAIVRGACVKRLFRVTLYRRLSTFAGMDLSCEWLRLDLAVPSIGTGRLGLVSWQSSSVSRQVLNGVGGERTLPWPGAYGGRNFEFAVGPASVGFSPFHVAKQPTKVGPTRPLRRTYSPDNPSPETERPQPGACKFRIFAARSLGRSWREGRSRRPRREADPATFVRFLISTSSKTPATSPAALSSSEFRREER